MLRYDEIAKLKNFGNYKSETCLSQLLEKIEDLVKDDGLQLEPDFQRGHVWTIDQQVAFVEFILKGGRTQEILFNHPGWMKDWKGEFVCVDGLQRLTALIKFLRNDLPVFGGHRMTDIEGIKTGLRGLYITIYINTLQTRREVLEWYLELNAGGTVHTQDELNRVRRLLNAA